MTITIVSSGQTATGTVASGDTLEVMSGGLASNLIVSGTEQVFAGGSSLSASIRSGGTEQVFSGGVDLSAVNGGTMIVYGGGNATSAVVDTELDVSGGTVTDTIVSAGVVNVFAGGTASNTTLVFGLFTSYQTVFSGGTAVGTKLPLNRSETVSSGGASISATVGRGSSEIVESGGFTTGTILTSASVETLSGGTAIATVIGSGAVIQGNSGSASGTIVNSGGGETGAATSSFGLTYTDSIVNSGGTIGFANLAYSSSGSATLDSNNVLTVVEGAQTYSQHLLSSYTGEYFHALPVSGGISNTYITLDSVPCYCRGTLILTDGGERAVEDLRIGDVLVTHAGEARALRWIGRRGYAGRFAAGNRDVLPVVVRAGALAEGVPRRDLFVSPLHALLLDGVLIPAVALVNGGSIVQVEAVDRVEYFHLELDSHDVIVAEGAAAESFVDDDSRGMFVNAAEHRALYPGQGRRAAVYCAPRVEDGAVLEAVRRRLAARAAGAHAGAGRLEGSLDVVERGRVAGWARDADAPGRAVALRVLDNGVVIGGVVADRGRADLAGGWAFEFGIEGGLEPSVRHVIAVERVSDGAALPGGPALLDAVAAPAVVQTPAEEAVRWGYLDTATRGRVAGWAHDPAAPGEAVALQIVADGAVVARVVANRARADLAAAGFGDGRHSFDVSLPGRLSPLVRHVVQVRRERDGAELSGSPVVIAAASAFDAGLERAVAEAVAALEAGERERVLAFMLAQADALRQGRADAEAGRAWGQARAREAKRALVIDARVPLPGRDAGSQAVLSHVRSLVRLGYSVSFAAMEMGASAVERAALAEAGAVFCGAPQYGSVEEVLRRQAHCWEVVYLHRAEAAGRYLALARAHAPRARVLYSVADLHHVRLERQAAVEERPELLGHARRMRLAECTAAWSADAVLTHSDVEADLLRRAVPEAEVHQVVWDVAGRRMRVPFAGRSGVAFVGGFGHGPNVDAARWLVEAVMPLVWQEAPEIGCVLAGSEMPEVVRRLGGPGVVVLGQVEDVGAAVFDRVRLSVAPLRFGAGVKGKVLESFAAGVPCVMSPVAAEGLALPAGLRGLVGADAAGLAALVVRLHGDGAAYRRASAAGRAFVRRGFGAAAVDAGLLAAIEGRMVRELAA